MQNIIAQISQILKVPNIDVYFLGILLVVFIVFCILGINKLFEILAGLVLGIAIFIVFQYLLLNPNLTVPTFIDQKIGKFIVGSSIYLIFILSVLVPLNGSFNIRDPKNVGIKILQTLLLSILLQVFYLAIIIGFIEKSYIYSMDNAFQMILTKRAFWGEFSTTSKVYANIRDNVPTITLISVFFVVYVVTFHEVMMMLFKFIGDIFKQIGKAASKKGGGGGGGGGDGGGGGHGHH